MHVTISFVIPAFNEGSCIGDCVSSIKATMGSTPPPTIIVGNHNSSDQTKQISLDHGAIVVDVIGGNVSKVRNEAAKLAKEDGFIAFIDADVRLDSSWLEKIKEKIPKLDDPDRDLFGSFCVAPKRQGILHSCWFSKLNTNNKNYLGSAHLVCSKKIFDTLKGFNENLETGEDYDFCSRAIQSGSKIHYFNDLIAYHDGFPTTVKSFIKREAWHATGDFSSLSSLLQSKVALMAVLFISLHVALLVNTPTYAILMGILSLCTISSFFKFKSLTPKQRFLNIGVFYLYFLGRSIGAIKQVFKRKGERASS